MKKKYRRFIYEFKIFNPSKKFSSFDFTELSWDTINEIGGIGLLTYCEKNEILKINGLFYIYAGETYNDWYEKNSSVIRFKNHKTVIKEIPI